jgi:polysaccharide export outer membrane protein
MLSVAGMCAPVSARAAQGDAPSTREVLDYRIGAGDVLQLFVWKEPDLTKDITVRFDGKVTIPLLGDVEAAGRTPQQLGEELTRGLARYLAAPQVTLGVSQANSARFHVIGQVGRPGDFPLARRITVLQALAIAGGFREFAKTDDIVIIRQDGDKETALSFNYKHIEGGKDLSQDIPLHPGDTIVVP